MRSTAIVDGAAPVAIEADASGARTPVLAIANSDAQRDLSDDEAQRFFAKLALVLANHIGDRAVLGEAIRVAAKPRAHSRSDSVRPPA